MTRQRSEQAAEQSFKPIVETNSLEQGKEMFIDRARRTKDLYSCNLFRGGDKKLLLKALNHDLALCEIGFQYCQKLNGESLSEFTSDAIVKEFDIRRFGYALNWYAFQLTDVSDEGSRKDHELREYVLDSFQKDELLSPKRQVEADIEFLHQDNKDDLDLKRTALDLVKDRNCSSPDFQLI